MNILMTWIYPIDDRIVDKLVKELNVERCVYMYSNESNVINREGFVGISLLEQLSFYRKNRAEANPIDQELLDKLAPYEEQCMNIINRWKRSYVVDYSYGSLRELYYDFVIYWNDLIEKNNIGCYIINAIPHVVPTFFSYVLCKVKNIPIIMLNYMPYQKGAKGKYIMTTGYEAIDPFFEERQREYRMLAKSEDSIELVEYFEAYFEQYLNTNNEKVQRVIGYTKKKSVQKSWELFVNKGMEYVRKKEYGILLKKMKYILFLRASEKRFISSIERYEELPVEEEKFVFFPLHMQPEATTLPMGGRYVNQFLVIKMLAHALPEGVKLYVKEHPTYWTRNTNVENIREGRTEDFYRKIKELENVRLIKHDINSLDLMDKMLALVTITGTAGFEAFFKKKPVIFFGHVPYNKFVGAYHVQTNEECRVVLSEIASGNAIKYTIKDIRVYLKALEKYSLSLGTIDPTWIENGVPKLTEEDLLTLTEKIVEFYKDVYASRQ